MGGCTFDTGALIALESRRLRMRRVLEFAYLHKLSITVPAAVVAEWWRGRSDWRDQILASVSVEPLNDALAKRAGEALAGAPGVSAVDAIVMASAAQRGDVVYTSDFEDLHKLQAHFPSVRVLRT
jgi:predicted nucleic acid-binding protein